MRSLPFGKPLSSDETNSLVKGLAAATREAFGVDLRDVRTPEDVWSTVGIGRVFVMRLNEQAVHFPVQPAATLRRRIAAYKPDAFLAVLPSRSVAGGKLCRAAASVSMFRNGQTMSLVFTQPKGWHAGHAPETKGSLIDLLYRGMGDAWNLPVSDEGAISLASPTDPDNIQAVLEHASRVGQPFPTDVLAFTTCLVGAGLFDPELQLVEFALRRPETKDDKPADLLIATILEKQIGCCWAVAGMPIYELTSSFLSLLLLTDPSNVPAGGLQFPFDTFFVRVPTPFWKLDNVCVVDGVRIPTGDITGFWVHKFVREGRQLFHVRVILAHQTYTFGVVLPLPTEEEANMPLGKWLHTHIEEEAEKRAGSAYAYLWRSILRALVNLSLYITEKRSEEASQTSVPTSARTKVVPFGLRPTTTVLCREVKLDRNLLDAAKAWTEAQRKNRTGWKLHSRYVVTGHWRNQVCGQRQKTPDGRQFWVNHHPKWIRPHVKGEGQLFRHVYRLGEESGVDSTKPDGTKPVEAGRIL